MDALMADAVAAATVGAPATAAPGAMPALAYCEPLPDFVCPDDKTERGFHCLRRMKMRSINVEEVVAAVASGQVRWLLREKRWAFHHEGTTVITDERRARPITCFREKRADEDGVEPRFVGPYCVAVPPSGAGPAGLALVGRPFLVTEQQFAGSFTLRGTFRIVFGLSAGGGSFWFINRETGFAYHPGEGQMMRPWRPLVRAWKASHQPGYHIPLIRI